MPLRVHCPSGCFIRVPSNRAGKIVRCPNCKKVIQLGPATTTEIQSGKPIPMSAQFLVSEKSHEVATGGTLPTIDLTSADKPGIELPGLDLDLRTARSERRLPVKSQASLQSRVSSANADRVVLSKFFAVCLCIVAAVNLAPAVYFWVQWSRTYESTVLPRWIYLQAFVAALHLIYAVFLVQIRDWSALKAVSVAMLTVAFVFGVVSTGLLAGGGQGLVARFLEIPYVLISQASIWCVAMLCLSTLMCYVGGRVAVNWQRTEQLLREIIS